MKIKSNQPKQFPRWVKKTLPYLKWSSLELALLTIAAKNSRLWLSVFLKPPLLLSFNVTLIYHVSLPLGTTVNCIKLIVLCFSILSFTILKPLHSNRNLNFTFFLIVLVSLPRHQFLLSNNDKLRLKHCSYP